MKRAAPPPFGVVAVEKGAFGWPSTTVVKLLLLIVFIKSVIWLRNNYAINYLIKENIFLIIGSFEKTKLNNKIKYEKRGKQQLLFHNHLLFLRKLIFILKQKIENVLKFFLIFFTWFFIH